MGIFMQLTAGLTDGQYYALIILISFSAGCAVVLLMEYLQAYFHQNYGKVVLLRKRLMRYARRSFYRVRG